MQIIVVGCGRTGALLASSLTAKGHRVTVVDEDNATFARLGPDFRGRTVHGVGFDRDVLLRAGIEEADGVAAVTNDEMVNLVVAYIARQHFHVPRVVARLYETERSALYERLGVPVVSAVSWRVGRLEQMLCESALHVTDTLGNGEVVAVNLRVPEQWAGRSLSSLTQPGRVIVVALIRAGGAHLATPEMSLQPGDVLRLVLAAEALEELQEQVRHAGGETCAL